MGGGVVWRLLAALGCGLAGVGVAAESGFGGVTRGQIKAEGWTIGQGWPKTQAQIADELRRGIEQ